MRDPRGWFYAVSVPWVGLAALITYVSGINTIDCGLATEHRECERTIEHTATVGLAVQLALLACLISGALLPQAKGKRRYLIVVPILSLLVASYAWIAASNAVHA
jgi:hypothetical protein